MKTTNNQKMRLSFSLLSLWAKGDVDGAVQAYYHLDRPSNKAMDEGKKLHKEFEEHILKSKKLPDFMPKITLSNPIPEKVITVEYDDMFDLKVIIDCQDGDSIFEFKTGNTNSKDYLNSYQIPFYFLTTSLTGESVEKAYIINYNQHLKSSNFVIMWNSERLVNKARNYIETLGPEIREHFINQGIL